MNAESSTKGKPLGEFLRGLRGLEISSIEKALANEPENAETDFRYCMGVENARPVRSLCFADVELFLRFSLIPPLLQRAFAIEVSRAMDTEKTEQVYLKAQWSARAKRTISFKRSGHALLIALVK